MNKRRFQFFMFVSLLIVTLLAVSSVGAAPKDGPVVTLSTAQTEFSASQDVLVTVTYTNPTGHSVRILQWFTPANGLEEPVFDVKVNGEPVAYIGAIYKRPAATGNDFMTLKAGQNVSYSVNLGEYYDLTATGQYEIYYKAASFYLYSEKGNGLSNPDYLVSAPISLKVDGRVAKGGKPTPPPPPPPGGTSYDACTVTQQVILVDARNQAKTYATTSMNYLPGVKDPGTERYLEWFGVFTTSRYNTVSSHYAALTNAWTNAGVTFHCGCKQNYYAYVYPDRPYEIWLCRVFWTAPLAGTDSQGGTLIHEMSHFTVVASTDDYVYGQSGARNLADTNPDQAIMNADNHEYFAENNPYKP
jgi:peptidyl-Lys metalloendopeptidase